MLACTALVGCSDDDVLNNAEQESQQGEKMRAYMTFSIASSTNSSRGATNSGTTTGDSDGNQEHSGHENGGTDAENKINEVLIAFYNTQGDDGFSGLYTMDAKGESSTNDLTFNSYSTKLVKNSDGSYELEKPFALNSLGQYKALFIINPASAIKDEQEKTTNSASGVGTFYNWVTTNAASSVDDIIGSNKTNFMMANRKEVTINVTNLNNDPSNPAYYTDGGTTEAPIEVERVVSKITFRHKPAASDFPENGIGFIKDGKNLYEIREIKYDYDIVKSNFWLKNSDGIYNYLTNLYKAEAPDGNVYWVYVDAEGNTTRYVIDATFKGTADDKRGEAEGAQGDGLYEGELQGDSNVKAQVVVASTYTGTLVYVGSKKVSNEDPGQYYVQLKKYAIVNKNNQVYYVRHTSTAPENATKDDVWGIVGSKNYLIEPNTATKSNLTFTSPLEWSAASTYFNDDFMTVTSYLETTNPAQQYFKSFATTGEGDVEAGKTPNDTEFSDEDPTATATTPDYTTVGTLMDYVLENSVIADNQNALTSTGVIFEAQIYNKEGAVVDHMLGYNGSYYPSFLALQEATMGTTDANDDGVVNTADSPFWKYTDEEYNKMSVEQKQTLATTLANEGITLYQDGKCYYFSAEIKHFENNNDNVKGVMEYAIMRNNIYSLSVESVDKFGFSSIDLQSGVLNDSDTEQEKVYLTMKAKILPWIVRFNNITF